MLATRSPLSEAPLLVLRDGFEPSASRLSDGYSYRTELPQVAWTSFNVKYHTPHIASRIIAACSVRFHALTYKGDGGT